MALNQMLVMDHEVGKGTSPPKMLSIDDYPDWRHRFQNFCWYNDVRMLICVRSGYNAPKITFGDSKEATAFSALGDEERRMYEDEEKAYASITMGLPLDILHTFEQYTTAKTLWDALEARYEGDTKVKKGRIDLLKAQFLVFKYMNNESMEGTINRFYHLIAEMKYFNIEPSVAEKKEKLLDAMPSRWDQIGRAHV